MEWKYNVQPDDYFIDPINSTDNENLIQLKLGIDWYKKAWDSGDRHNILQLGNVLGTYGYCERHSIDVAESIKDDSVEEGYAGVTEYVSDIMAVDFSGKKVISINAFNREYYSPALFDKIHAEAESYFITINPNSNPQLDSHFLSLSARREEKLSNFEWHGWQRAEIDKWNYTERDMSVLGAKKDEPFPSANGIVLFHKDT